MFLIKKTYRQLFSKYGIVLLIIQNTESMGVGLGDGKKEMFSGDSLSRELGKTVVKVTEFFFFHLKKAFFLS